MDSKAMGPNVEQIRASCIAGVIASPADVRAAISAAGGDVLEHALNDRVAKVNGGAA